MCPSRQFGIHKGIHAILHSHMHPCNRVCDAPRFPAFLQYTRSYHCRPGGSRGHKIGCPVEKGQGYEWEDYNGSTDR